LAEREQGFEVAGQIRVLTLILHPNDDQMVPYQNSLDMAAKIPGARRKFTKAGKSHIAHTLLSVLSVSPP
jgi:hypothetical protein